MDTLTTLVKGILQIEDLAGSAPPRELHKAPTWAAGSKPWSKASAKNDPWKDSSAWGFIFLVGVWVLISPKLKVKLFQHKVVFRFLDPYLNADRCYDNFVNARVKPRVPAETFQVSAEYKRAFLYMKLFKTTIWRGNRMILSSGALAVGLSWWIRNSPKVAATYSNWKYLEPETVRINMAAAATFNEGIVPVCSFLLALYVVFHVFWLYRILDAAWHLQGRIYDLSLLLAALLSPYRQDYRVQDALWAVFRHLNVLHVLAYAEVSDLVSMQANDLQAIASGGLLTPNEVEELEPADNRSSVVVTWLSDMLNRLVEAQVVPQVFAGSSLDALSGLQGAISSFIAKAKRSSGAPFGIVMQVAADVMCVTTPAALCHIFSKDDSAFPAYFWPGFGSMATAVFFQGSVKLAKALETPFEMHVDGLNPDHALALTERQVFGCLAGGEDGPPMPEVPRLLQAVPLAPPKKKQPPPRSDADFWRREPGEVRHGLATEAASYRNRPYEADELLHESMDEYDMGRPVSRAPQPSNFSAGLEQVPGEYLPDETHFVPDESGDRGEYQNGETNAEYEPITVGVTRGKGKLDDRYIKGARWGDMDMGLLQATRAALLVPREITLDQVSLERLETVTARPLAELAAAIFRAERSQAEYDERQLAIEDKANGHGNGYGAVSRSHNGNGNGAASGDVNDPSSVASGLYGLLQNEMNASSELRSQIATLRAQGALAAASSQQRSQSARAAAMFAPAPGRNQMAQGESGRSKGKKGQQSNTGPSAQGEEVLALLQKDVARPLDHVVPSAIEQERAKKSVSVTNNVPQTPGSKSLALKDSYLAPQLVSLDSPTRLCIKEKSFSLSGGDLKIRKEDGSDFLKIKGKSRAARNRMVLCDLGGAPVAVCVEKSVVERCFYVYGLESRVSNQSASTEYEEGRPLYSWAKVTVNVASHPKSYTMSVATGNDTFDSANQFITVPGGPVSSKVTIKRRSQDVCHIDTAAFAFDCANSYSVTVFPGIDPVLMLCFVAIKDELVLQGDRDDNTREDAMEEAGDMALELFDL
jgi:hypothetical protein